MSRRKNRTTATRRDVLKGLAAATACAATAKNAAGQQADDDDGLVPPPAKPAPVTAEDIAGAQRTLGLEYSDAQRRLMLGRVAERRERFTHWRKLAIDPNVEPAMRFDPRLPETKLPTGESVLRLSATVEAPEVPPEDELPFASVAEVSALIRSKKVSSTELTKLCLERLERIGQKLNAVIALTEERALKEAARADAEIAAGDYRGPLHGIPYGAKDLLAAEGAITTWGIDPYKFRSFHYDATVVERLAAAGAVLVAKLSLGELAMGDVWYGGKTRNPWNVDEGSSGSSAGPAACVAAGLVPFAIGSETLGSIVSPCVACGATGLRPTYGRVSRYGAMPLCRSMDKLGPMARRVEDCAAVLHAIHGPDGRDGTAVANVSFAWDGLARLPPLRVGVDKVAFDQLADKRYDGEVRKVYEEALDLVRSLLPADSGLVPVTLPPTTNYAGLASLTIAAESACSFTELLHSPFIHDLVQQEEGSWPNVFRAGSMIPASDYLRAMQLRAMLQREVAAAMKDVDVMVSIPFVGPQSAYTNLTGHPSVVTRCGFVNDRPKSIEFIGQLFREDQLLKLAHEFERACGVSNKWPKL